VFCRAKAILLPTNLPMELICTDRSASTREEKFMNLIGRQEKKKNITTEEKKKIKRDKEVCGTV